MIPAAHLNDWLKRVLPVVGKGHVTPAAALAGTRAPYLTHEDDRKPGEAAGYFTHEEAVAANLFAEDGLVRTPYQAFRFCASIPARKASIFGYVQREPGTLLVVLGMKAAESRGDVWAIVFNRAGDDADMLTNAYLYDADLVDRTYILEDIKTKQSAATTHATALSSRADAAEAEALVARYRAGQVAKSDVIAAANKLKDEVRLLEIRSAVLHGICDTWETSMDLNRVNRAADHCTKDGVDAMVLSYYQVIMSFCYQYLAPFNFTARVTPDKPGKSVEWLQAREHYTVIHRHHPVNQAGVKEGATVDDRGHTARLAHSRRAHTKLLKSERYTAMRGQRIFVKATWVGPKEWRDSAAQIYRIVPRLTT